MRTQQRVVWMIVYLLAAVLLASGVEYGDRLAVAIQEHQQRAIDQRVKELKRQLEEAQDDPMIFYPFSRAIPILPTSGRP
ncbi:MAG TPA: hypothetical protein PKD55_08765 [Bellilinea sp.]|nr:hypothetical protein [Bellilinea sp.]